MNISKCYQCHLITVDANLFLTQPEMKENTVPPPHLKNFFKMCMHRISELNLFWGALQFLKSIFYNRVVHRNCGANLYLAGSTTKVSWREIG